MGGKIECFLDLASYFSYIAFTDLAQNRDKLAANGVEIEIHPVLLGGINHLSGNRPPWTNEIKAAYLKYDSRRAAERVGLFGIQGPPDLMSVSHTVSPLRALHYIKANYPQATFLATFESLFKAFWTPPHVNLIPEENLRAVLQGATENPGKGSGKKLFTEEEVEKILKARGGMKDVLMATTQRAVDQGAFGAPWIWVTNAKGEQEPFFGSDRFHHIYKFLDIPFQDIAVLTPSKL
ncbi:DSBA family oxidoreductase [Trichoderma guizhouense]|uniref:Glutathione S-transferase kappa 1 n=1 Tax=Trichoderma guizhouense TaxID=1491466 RepID=A0A1T3CEG3_9HYPO|nr:DSBA family oxidoreductase [Trichoderma guizhouense]